MAQEKNRLPNQGVGLIWDIGRKRFTVEKRKLGPRKDKDEPKPKIKKEPPKIKTGQIAEEISRALRARPGCFPRHWIRDD